MQFYHFRKQNDSCKPYKFALFKVEIQLWVGELHLTKFPNWVSRIRYILQTESSRIQLLFCSKLNSLSFSAEIKYPHRTASE